MKIEAIFIDRDGTLGDNAEVEYPDRFRPFPGIKPMIESLRARRIKAFIFTNQSCIARGKDNGYDFISEFKGYGADDWFICPHDTDDRCECRKPQSGLLLAAAGKYGLDLKRCVVIGDRWTDIEAGAKAGAKGILVLTGRGKDCVKMRPPALEESILAVCEDVFEAVGLLLTSIH